MNTIVQQMTENLAQKICQLIEKNGFSDVDNFACQALNLCNESVAELIALMVRQLNMQIREDKIFRKEQGLSLKEKHRPRELLTAVGQIRIERDYYQMKESGEYCYPLDTMIGLKPYVRVGDELSAQMINQAAEVSYEKSAQTIAKGQVSRQTVKNKLQTVGILEIEGPSEKRVVKELHVFADEDHVPLRGRKNRQVPLISVCEGIDSLSSGRNALLRPVHFTAKIKETKAAWERVAGYIEKAYAVESLERVYLHGDGASWIRQGIAELPVCVFVMDGFHFEKHLRQATAGLEKQNYRFRLRQAITQKDRTKALTLIKEMCEITNDPKRQKRIMEFRKYLKSHWEGIVRRYTEEIIGSCTEGLISHVYAERLSRNPLAWSEQGLDKMAELRVYTRNGGRVRSSTLKRSIEEKKGSVLKKYAQERLRQAISGCKDWSLFERAVYTPSVNTATQILIRSFGKQRSLVG